MILQIATNKERESSLAMFYIYIKKRQFEFVLLSLLAGKFLLIEMVLYLMKKLKSFCGKVIYTF